MIFDVIRGIINSSLTLEEKLDRIIGVVEKAEAFEMMAVESAAQFGRKPTWRDRAELLAREERRRPDKLSREDLVSNTEDGINWLKRNIKERKYFEIEGEFKPYIAKHEPPVDDRPIEMLGFAPWEVSLTILTLGDWVNHCSQNDTEAIESIERGKAYLREIQVLLREGGLGDSFWFNEMPVGEKEYPGNVLETAVSISPLNLSTRGLTSDYTESVEEAIAYLMSCRNEHGAWGFKKGWKSDLKCTAITMMALMATRLRRKISFLSDDELDEVIYKGLEWLLRREKSGFWEYEAASKENVVFASFYGIESLAVARVFIDSMTDANAKSRLTELHKGIESSFWRTLRRYESSQKLIKQGEKEGWGWESRLEPGGVENTAAGLIVLLDAEWVDATTPLVEKASKWLLKQKDPDRFWGLNTPLVLMAFIRIIEETSRLKNAFAGYSKQD